MTWPSMKMIDIFSSYHSRRNISIFFIWTFTMCDEMWKEGVLSYVWWAVHFWWRKEFTIIVHLVLWISKYNISSKYFNILVNLYVFFCVHFLKSENLHSHAKTNDCKVIEAKNKPFVVLATNTTLVLQCTFTIGDIIKSCFPFPLNIQAMSKVLYLLDITRTFKLVYIFKKWPNSFDICKFENEY